jgi:hypothetical protein
MMASLSLQGSYPIHSQPVPFPIAVSRRNDKKYNSASLVCPSLQLSIQMSQVTGPQNFPNVSAVTGHRRAV